MTTPIREKMIAQVAAQRDALRARDPLDLARRCGVEFRDGAFYIPFYGELYRVTFPALEAFVAANGKPCGLNRTAMFLYYLQTADGAAAKNTWVAFRDFPGGMFYHQAYQGYSGDRLAKAIDNRINVFERAAKQLGGMKLDIGDAAFAFEALPRVRVAAVYYVGDEDFPASANVLFDGAADHYLPVDALAGVGSALVDRLTATESKDDQE